MRNYSKQTYLRNARSLIEKNTEDSLVYAALELRHCLESIVYERLEGYKKYVPGIVFTKWQPHHALKILLDFEPRANEDFQLAIAPESSPGVTSGPFQLLGDHKEIDIKWLTKNYNKLGNYLHVQRGKSKTTSKENLKNALKKIVNKLEDILKGNITSLTISDRISFNCGICKKNTLANADVVRKSKRAICINPECNATYFITEEGDKWNIKLEETSFKCLNCETDNFVPNSDIHIGMKFTCFKCSEKHIIIGYDLKYSKIEDLEEKK